VVPALSTVSHSMRRQRRDPQLHHRWAGVWALVSPPV